jgi:hypothetical protein
MDPKQRVDKRDAKQALERVILLARELRDGEHQQTLGMVAGFLHALLATHDWGRSGEG